MFLVLKVIISKEITKVLTKIYFRSIPRPQLWQPLIIQ